jgi:hypothetical protein
MAPIEGVIQVQGDITNARTAEVVCTAFPFTSVNRCLFFLSKYELSMPLISVEFENVINSFAYQTFVPQGSSCDQVHYKFRFI